MLKKLVLGLGGLMLMLIAAALAAPLFIPAEKFRGVIVTQAEEALGHSLEIGGDLRFSIFPFVGVYAENITIGKSQQAGAPALATFKSMNVEVGTLALLSGEVVVQSLTLDAPVINLRVDAAGKPNWEGKPGLAPQDAGRSGGGSAPKVPLRNLALDNVRLVNGVLVYEDAAKKERWELKAINLDVALSSIASPFELKGDAEFRGRKIAVSGVVETLQTLLSDERADIAITAKSDLLSVNAKGAIKSSTYSGSLDVQSPSITQAASWLTGKPVADFASPLPLKLASNAACSAEACHFSKASIALASMEAQGDVKARFSSAVPAVELQLNTNELDFNLFMAPQKSAGISLVSPAYAAESWSDAPIDFSALRSLDLIANINAAGIRMQNIVIGKTALRAKIQRGKLSMNIIDAQFYGGKTNITANIDASGATPVIDKRINFSGIQMEPLLVALDATDRFSGRADFTMQVTSSGASERQLVSGMNGSGSFKCADGAIKGINIAEMIRNVQSAFMPVERGAQQTDFTEATGTFTIAKGVISNNDLSMKAPLFRVSGAGTVNLPQRTIHYRLNPQVVETTKGQGGKDKQGIGVPVIIEGSFDNLRYRPDLESTIREAIQNPEAVKETIGNIKEQLKDGKGGLKDVLQKDNLQNLLKKF